MARRGPVPQADDRRSGSGGLPVDVDVAMDALTRAHRDLDRPQNGLPTEKMKGLILSGDVVACAPLITGRASQAQEERISRGVWCHRSAQEGKAKFVS